MQKYIIRTANEKDAVDCIHLSKMARSEWRAHNENLGKKHIKDCIHNKRCLVATKDSEIIAFLVWGNLWNKIHIQDVFVKEEYRKDGIATRLLEKLIMIGKKEGFKEIMSDTDVSNISAIKFHLKCGFTQCGLIKKNWDDEDSCVFSMKIL